MHLLSIITEFVFSKECPSDTIVVSAGKSAKLKQSFSNTPQL
jgi:hypothetical protein